MLKSREWLNNNERYLKRWYRGKTIVVCNGQIIKSFEGISTAEEINKFARKHCKGKDWCYMYLPTKEEEEELKRGWLFLFFE
jgi:hypothetical protein